MKIAAPRPTWVFEPVPPPWGAPTGALLEGSYWGPTGELLLGPYCQRGARPPGPPAPEPPLAPGPAGPGTLRVGAPLVSPRAVVAHFGD